MQMVLMAGLVTSVRVRKALMSWCLFTWLRHEQSPACTLHNGVLLASLYCCAAGQQQLAMTIPRGTAKRKQPIIEAHTTRDNQRTHGPPPSTSQGPLGHINPTRATVSMVSPNQTRDVMKPNLMHQVTSWPGSHPWSTWRRRRKKGVALHLVPVGSHGTTSSTPASSSWSCSLAQPLCSWW